ncbi:hypothetical protein BJF92_12475 [Rhizobium rhizosphaerae]|uniref:YhdP central domain-containing protein n=1 Tax=Xaviernesmea rhizosphaerae TaxID=1672749 RepID=A0A1Q9ANG4_9HYPH|nr:DUF3971 domain-containing protein [Xaviernesmea rhizosphaerae]OLP56876.1 hypothetical protein BJF92_12475 [Xaviernesmea rhizosphaerae]
MSDIRNEHEAPPPPAATPPATTPGAPGETGAGKGRTRRRRGWPARLFNGCLGLIVIVILGAAGLVAAMENGAFDSVLNERATAALDAAVGENFRAEVRSTVLRLSPDGGLALRARGVALIDNASNAQLMSADAVSIEVDMRALLSGRLAVTRIEADGATFDSALLPSGGPLDLTTLRIASVPQGLDAVFKQMDAIETLISRSQTNVVRLSDVKLALAGPRNRVVSVDVERLDFARAPDGSMAIDGAFSIDGHEAELHLKAERGAGRIERLSGALSGLPLQALLYRPETDTEPAFGIQAEGGLSIEAIRGQGGAPGLTLSAHVAPGTFHAGDLQSDVLPSDLTASYDFDRRVIVLQPSMLRFGDAVYPLAGTLADLADPADPQAKGFAIDLGVIEGLAAATDVNEAPLPFNATIKGQFLTQTRNLVLNEMAIHSALGSLVGSLSVQFGTTSPGITFAALTTDMASSAVKQLWPWWMGKNARNWVVANIFGGTVKNGKIEVSIAEGRLAATPGPVDLDENELKLDFSIADARVNIAGDIPPLRDADGSLKLRGKRVEIQFDKAASYFPSGRKVMLDEGTLIMPDVHTKPLMAEMRLAISGQADAVAELTTFKPIDALRRTPFKPDDFRGQISAHVGARIGLINDQHPPPPQWQAELQLDGVSLTRPFSGRTITDVEGALRIDPQQAQLDATGKVDSFPLDLTMVEPIGDNAKVKRLRTISGTLPSGALTKLAPELSSIVTGPMGLDMSLEDGGRQVINLDLAKATVTFPYIGWSKGPGVPAKAALTVTDKNGTTSVRGLKLTGDSFGIAGDMVLDKAGLVSAQFGTIRLSTEDDFALGLKRQKGGYAINVSGDSLDARTVIAGMKEPGGKPTGVGDPQRISVTGNLNAMRGFHGEQLSNVNLSYAAKGREISGLTLSAVTGSSQAVVARMAADGDTVELTSGDAGAVARFADIYSNMRGGLLNLKLRARGAGSWRGTVDIRKFSIVDEARLQSMVSSPAPDGRSLGDAAKKDIDVKTARFERAFANLALDGGAISVGNGVVRGVDVGATFQGTVRDANGMMDMTGTFMPAYGLNRLFGAVPIIGDLLGNGRDRGLLGITFKLSGRFDKPDLTINPLSIIAPGVFRSIFEFQ